MRALRKRERGQGLVEFALVLPLFLVLVLAVIDFGWALRAYINATNAAREGARVAVLGESVTAIKSRAVSKSTGMLGTTNVCVIYPVPEPIPDPPTCATTIAGISGNSVAVQVNYTYSYITPLGGILNTLTGGAFPATLVMKPTTVMRLE